ncbi:MAG: glycoside hydrolase family 2 TIM barrel-domain containing protein [Anaerolineae bacterium]|nr:glycoside hydrolase family 2 TIM barrel-domain containing protein [Anaerolineae bacterium]
MESQPRQQLLFDQDWTFTREDISEAEAPSYDEAGWSTLDLPHDWSIEGPFSQEAKAGGGGGYLPGGIGWYRKRFTLPEQDRNKQVSIQFDGVYKNCDVWLNGTHLGFHPYGYTSFYFDITPYLYVGKEENVLAVRVDNSQQPDARWYNGSGIFRHVWLTLTSPLHVAHWGTFVRTPLVSDILARVEVLTRVKNDSDDSKNSLLITNIVDAEGEIVGKTEDPHPLAPGQEYEFVQNIRVSSPHLWSVEDPYLYRLQTVVKDSDRTVDIYETPLGIRDIAFDADCGFLLNGQQVKINGVCLHHDGGCVGAAVPKRVWERRLETLKAMGCNGIRSSHYPPSPEFLDLCDQMGFLVMDENFDEWRIGKFAYGYHQFFDTWAITDTVSMVRRDRNHPSIVIWSVGNEIPEQTVPEGVAVLKKLVDIIHLEDPTRPVTSACDNIEAHIPATQTFLDTLDVVGYNYADRWAKRRELCYSIDRHQFPQRKMIGTENVSVSGVRGEYEISGSRGWRGPYYSRMVRAEQLWKFTHLSDYVAGDFMWTGIDYLGESRWPSKNSSSGPIDMCGFPKDAFYFYQSQWTGAPVMHIFPHWTWPGREGQVIPVICYTNCDSVELFLNGTSFGEQVYAFPRYGMDPSKGWGEQDWMSFARPSTADLHLRWTVPYTPGVLKAVGKRNGEVVCEQEVVTAGPPSQIHITADRETIAANGRDIVHLTVKALDAAGNFVPTADNLITFEVQGTGHIIGVDNGNPASHEPFQANQRQLFNGLCLAVIQSTRQPGTITIQASAPGLSAAEVTIHAS